MVTTACVRTGEEMDAAEKKWSQWLMGSGGGGPGQNWRDGPLVRAGPGEKKMGEDTGRINDLMVNNKEILKFPLWLSSNKSDWYP